MNDLLLAVIISGYFVVLALGSLLGYYAGSSRSDAATGVMLYTLVAGLAALLMLVVALVIGFADSIDTTAAPQQVKPAQQAEPYGGCDEAFRYPKSEGYAWCRDNGYLD